MTRDEWLDRVIAWVSRFRSPSASAPPPAVVHPALDEQKDQFTRYIAERLQDEALSQYITTQAEMRADAAIKKFVSWRARLVWLLGVGTLVSLFWFAVRYIESETAKIQASLETIGIIPAMVFKTGSNLQKLRDEQLNLAASSGGGRRWELEDKIEELEVLRQQIGPRLATSVRLLAGGQITRAAFDRGEEATSLFNDAIGQPDTQEGRRVAEQLLHRAIAADQVLDPPFIDLARERTGLPLPEMARNVFRAPSFAEPRIRLATLVIEAFSDRVNAKTTAAELDADDLAAFARGAVVTLENARAILDDSRNPFYGTSSQTAFLLALLEYQLARAYTYYAIGCASVEPRTAALARIGQVCPADARTSKRALASLAAAERHYARWRQLSRPSGRSESSSGSVNAKMTLLRAQVAMNLDGDLEAAERLAVGAIAAAKNRGAEYGAALNLAAWIYIVGNRPSDLDLPSYARRASDRHYREHRFRAVRYAYRALHIAPVDDFEYRARVEATRAMALALVHMDHHAALANYASIRWIDDWGKQARRDDPRWDPPAWRTFRDAVCRRLSQPGVPIVHTYHAALYRAMRYQVQVRAASLCKQSPSETDLAKADAAFQDALREASVLGRGDMLAEFGHAMNDVLRASLFTASGPAGVPPHRKADIATSAPAAPRAGASNHLRTLDRLHNDPAFLTHEYVLRGNPRTVLLNNIAWQTLSGRSDVGYDGRPVRPPDTVALAREAVMDEGWRAEPVLHTLAAALYEQATRSNDDAAWEDGQALIMELMSEENPSEKVRQLAACFVPGQARQPRRTDCF